MFDFLVIHRPARPDDYHSAALTSVVFSEHPDLISLAIPIIRTLEEWNACSSSSRLPAWFLLSLFEGLSQSVSQSDIQTVSGGQQLLPILILAHQVWLLHLTTICCWLPCRPRNLQSSMMRLLLYSFQVVCPFLAGRVEFVSVLATVLDVDDSCPECGACLLLFIASFLILRVFTHSTCLFPASGPFCPSVDTFHAML